MPTVVLSAYDVARCADIPGHLWVYVQYVEGLRANGARFPGCGLPWRHIRPPVSLEHWPAADGNGEGAFTTVSSWWGDEWVADRDGYYENNKRVSFLGFREVAERTDEQLELAIN